MPTSLQTVLNNGLATIATAMLIAGQAVKIDTARNTERERRTKTLLEQVLQRYDLDRYTFTRQIRIEEGAINHAFPVLTLNARFADAEDDLLSSFVHEQLHWHQRDHADDMRVVVAQLRQWYPRVPVGGTEGAETEYSTYGHLVNCYLEVQADRQLIGVDRTAAVVARKPHYKWIYATVLRDEARLRALVERNRLHITAGASR